RSVGPSDGSRSWRIWRCSPASWIVTSCHRSRRFRVRRRSGSSRRQIVRREWGILMGAARMRFSAEVPWLRSFNRAGLIALGVAAGCLNYTRVTTEQVQRAIEEAHVIGATPEDAIARLRAIRLADGQRLGVSDHLKSRNIVEAGVKDARRTWLTRWSVT